MKKILLSALFLIAVCGFLGFNLFNSKKNKHKYQIGIVVPVEHQAMDQMVEGFVSTLSEQYGAEIKIDVQNAGGDRNLQKAIIQNFKRKNVDQVVSIGTDVTLMTMNTIKKQPIIGLDVTNQVKQTQPNITGVLESPIDPSYVFLKELIQPCRKVAMVYSSSDKNYKMVETFTQLAKADGIAVQPIMIQSLPDLYVLSKRVDRDVDAIFIAKDHLVASGVVSLVKTAEKMGVPLVTSDEGTVIEGAALALGNKERDIGKYGANVLIGMIEGVPAHQIPINPVPEHTVFVNLEALEKQGISLERVQQSAEKLGYHIEFTEKRK